MNVALVGFRCLSVKKKEREREERAYEVAVKDVVNQLEEESIYEEQGTASYFGSKDEE